MKKNHCLAMLLAGGQGSRLGALTKHIAKPAVSFGGKYRIIDFSLSNCANSDITTVGVLTQYRPLILNTYIGTGSSWDLDVPGGGVSILPPYATENGGEWYKGTADAVYQNADYIRLHDPEYVLILSGDHLYRMNYRDMLKTHRDNGAELTISVMEVPEKEASRFGIITADEDGRIRKFTEKPKKPDSNLASMGIYIFNKDSLMDTLITDSRDEHSSHDFGQDIIPRLLGENRRVFCHWFKGYWKDVGTIESYHETSMALLDQDPEFDLFAKDFPIMSNTNLNPPHYIGEHASVDQCMIGNGSVILGNVRHSIFSVDTYVGEGAVVSDSILLPGARVEAGAKVRRAIMGEHARVAGNESLGSPAPNSDIAVIGDRATVGKHGRGAN
jgi:glucose-1-phosphate adenylyltransferase